MDSTCPAAHSHSLSDIQGGVLALALALGGRAAACLGRRLGPAGRPVDQRRPAHDIHRHRVRVGVRLGGGQLAFASRHTARLLPGKVRRAHVRGGPNNDAALARAFGDCMAVTGLVHQSLALSRGVGAGAGAVRARVVEEQHRAVVDRRAQEQRLRTAGPPSEQGRKTARGGYGMGIGMGRKGRSALTRRPANCSQLALVHCSPKPAHTHGQVRSGQVRIFTRGWTSPVLGSST